MREIKFRAWTGERMLNEVASNMVEVELMQYTGLEDKNGKEIFEGDIVEDEDHFYYEIQWDADDFMYIADGIGPLCELEFHEINVIGNIHENPELLEQK